MFYMKGLLGLRPMDRANMDGLVKALSINSTRWCPQILQKVTRIAGSIWAGYNASVPLSTTDLWRDF